MSSSLTPFKALPPVPTLPLIRGETISRQSRPESKRATKGPFRTRSPGFFITAAENGPEDYERTEDALAIPRNLSNEKKRESRKGSRNQSHRKTEKENENNYNENMQTLTMTSLAAPQGMRQEVKQND